MNLAKYMTSKLLNVVELYLTVARFLVKDTCLLQDIANGKEISSARVVCLLADLGRAIYKTVAFNEIRRSMIFARAQELWFDKGQNFDDCLIQAYNELNAPIVDELAQFAQIGKAIVQLYQEFKPLIVAKSKELDTMKGTDDEQMVEIGKLLDLISKPVCDLNEYCQS